MASIRPRKNKDGVITSYQIRVFKGYAPDGAELKPYTTSFKPDPNRTARQNEKALNAFVVDFENKCKLGLACDDRQTFAEYAEYVIGLKERQGVKHNTILSYKSLLPRINQAIGHLKLNEIRPQHLNNFYEQLAKTGMRDNTPRAMAKKDIRAVIKERNLTIKSVAEQAGINANTVSAACHGNAILEPKAKAIAEVLGESETALFDIKKDNRPLSNKTILEYHRFISVVLAQADKEMIILYNPASKATPPKQKPKTANYFQLEDVEKIRDSLENEPLKWKVITHLFLITGARRGEIAGLKWDVVDWKKSRIHICRNLLYSPDIGIYEDTTKTEQSDRYVTLPIETMQLLKEYRKWYFQQALKYGDRWHNTNYLFFQEKSGNEGKPISPDSINEYLDSFSKRYGLPHINPHAFRHTQASILYFNGIDSVSISARLGHSRVSTTSDIYAHIIKAADERSAECIADVILRPKNIDIKKVQ
ncbi:MAG: tyrosine-type recombinase/integrase [Ruminiclostridium sp.]|nr:tyrosine-type recombinase/integrase [Ruminiclostridium sp.]